LSLVSVCSLSVSHNSIYSIHEVYYSFSISLCLGLAISILWYWLAIEYSVYFYSTFGLCSYILTVTISGWMNDLWIESHFGLTRIEQYSTIVGIKLLLISELMLFFACFWCSIDFRFIISFPLLSSSSYSFSIAWSNACLLQLSSLPIQSSQLFIKNGDLSYAIESLGQGMLCSFLFIGLQLSEMLYSYYSFSSSMIGSIFYLTTGLHGLHVLIGSLGFYLVLLLLCLN